MQYDNNIAPIIHVSLLECHKTFTQDKIFYIENVDSDRHCVNTVKLTVQHKHLQTLRFCQQSFRTHWHFCIPIL